MKINKLIIKCKICNSTDITYIKKFEHEDIMLNDYDKNTPPVLRIDDVIKCNNCNTLHYIEDDDVITEFSPKLIAESKFNWISDFEMQSNLIKK